MGRRVLMIEDNADITRLVQMHLRDIHCELDIAGDGYTGLARYREKPHDLIILDLMLPGLDGLEVCKALRAEPGYVPILMLTAKSTELDRVLGLEVGADDYLTKPFSIPELLARIKALLRRVDALTHVTNHHSEPLKFDSLTIDNGRRQVFVGTREVNLTAREFDLLLHFALNPGHVYTRTQLLDLVWGYTHESYEHTVNSHINRLRAKIETDPAQPLHILTVWGVGYKFSGASL